MNLLQVSFKVRPMVLSIIFSTPQNQGKDKTLKKIHGIFPAEREISFLLPENKFEKSIDVVAFALPKKYRLVHGFDMFWVVFRVVHSGKHPPNFKLETSFFSSKMFFFPTFPPKIKFKAVIFQLAMANSLPDNSCCVWVWWNYHNSPLRPCFA